MQTPFGVAGLVMLQSLEILAARTVGARAWLVQLVGSACGQRQLARKRPRIDQQCLIEVDPAPGHQDSQRETTLDPQAPRPQPAAAQCRQAQLALADALRRHIPSLVRRVRPAQGDRLVRPCAAFQTQAKLPLFADEHRPCPSGLEHQTRQVTVGVQDGDDKQRRQQKRQGIGQAVLVIDRGQQHQQQRQGKCHPDPRRYDEDPPLGQAHAGGGRNPPGKPALPAPFEQLPQSAGTSRSNHCTSAPPPCPVGSLRSRRR